MAMYGHYLNLPVVEDGDVVGIVDVLKLTYATMEQINSIQGNDGDGGPMWGRFWDSFGAADQHESESQLSDPLSSQLLSAHSQNSNDNGHGNSNSNSIARAISPEPSASFSQLQGFSEITPNESASMVANNEESRSTLSEDTRAMGKGDDVFPFKFTSDGGKTHRFASVYNSYAALLEAVRQKVIGEHLAHLGANPDEDVPVESWLSISYLDDEEDQVLITSDADVSDAVKLARKMGQDRVKLFVHDATEKEPVAAEQESVVLEAAPVAAVVVEEKVLEPVAPPAVTPAPPAIEVTEAPRQSKRRSIKANKKEVILSDSEDDQEEEEEAQASGRGRNKQEGATVAGIPQELVLPAAIAFLGVVIVGVFAFSRVSPNHR
ncbi:hypothetical protein MBANPS3_004925 [Mucor bainieri]